MIKFNSFPPEKPGDVEFTEAGLQKLRESGQAQETRENNHAAKNLIHGFGQATGHVVFSAMEKPENIHEVMDPLYAQAKEEMQTNSIEFLAGVVHAADSARALEGATV